MSADPGYDVTVHDYVISLCRACIDGVGQECHTPGCTLFLHSVDLPIHRAGLTAVEPIWAGDRLAGYRVAAGDEAKFDEFKEVS